MRGYNFFCPVNAGDAPMQMHVRPTLFLRTSGGACVRSSRSGRNVRRGFGTPVADRTAVGGPGYTEAITMDNTG